MGEGVAIPASGRHLVGVLQKNSPRDESAKESHSVVIANAGRFVDERLRGVNAKGGPPCDSQERELPGGVWPFFEPAEASFDIPSRLDTQPVKLKSRSLYAVGQAMRDAHLDSSSQRVNSLLAPRQVC